MEVVRYKFDKVIIMKCLICNNEYKSNAGLGRHIKVSHHLSTQKYYDNSYIDCSLSNKYCNICGKENNFINFIAGYSLGCCTEHTNLIRYGVTNVYVSEHAKQNNFNYFELYSLEEIQNFFKDKLNIIVDISSIYHNL